MQRHPCMSWLVSWRIGAFCGTLALGGLGAVSVWHLQARAGVVVLPRTSRGLRGSMAGRTDGGLL